MDSVWMPIVPSSRLKSKPVDGGVLDLSLVLFRTGSGEAVAVQRACPHRGHDLIHGRVTRGGLECPYHGWTFGADGQGRSPGSPRTSCPIKTYATAEHLGFVWLRTQGDGAFEDSESYRVLQQDKAPFTGVVAGDFDGPLSVVVDNFNEIEHTGPVHGVFGYPTARLAEVQTSWERTAPGRFDIQSFGPQKPLPWPIRAFLGLRSSDWFSGQWTTTVRPWISSYDDRWFAGPSRETTQRAFGLGLRIFFVPLAKDRTRLVTFIFCTGLRLHAVARPVVTALIRREVAFDQKVVSRLIAPELPLAGRRLARFDAVLHQIRQDAEELNS